MTEATTAKVQKTLGTAAKIACLCIIMFQYAKAFSTPALSAIGAAFPFIDSTNLKLIESIPSLIAIPGAFSVAIFERFMKKKTILWMAMIMTLVGGVAAGFMPETMTGWYGIIACRVVLGFARGMIFPMASSFIADLFTGGTRDKLMSFKTASGGLSGVVFQMIGGALAVMSWRYSFIGYAFIIPIIIMVAIGLPEPDVKPIPLKAGGAKTGWPVWVLIILAGVFNIFMFSVFTNMSLCVKATGIGSPLQAATIMSSITFATAAAAILYGAVIKGHLGGFDIPISMVFMAVAFFIFSHYFTLSMYIAGAIIFGIGFGIYNPALILQCVKLIPREAATSSLSYLAAIQNLGQFLSAYVLAFLAPIMGAGLVVKQLAGWEVAWPFVIGFVVLATVLIAVVKGKNKSLIAGLPDAKME
ncbi:MAG: MFS transporter [Actinobacteria bacterium]|nr:MFS transporter [Actinomycetota bacterium]